MILFMGAFLPAQDAIGSTVRIIASGSGPISPAANEHFYGPFVPISASAVSSEHRVTGWAVYVDDHEEFRDPGPRSSLTTTVDVKAGTHTIVIKAWDSSGAHGSYSAKVMVGNSADNSTDNSGDNSADNSSVNAGAGGPPPGVSTISFPSPGAGGASAPQGAASGSSGSGSGVPVAMPGTPLGAITIGSGDEGVQGSSGLPPMTGATGNSGFLTPIASVPSAPQLSQAGSAPVGSSQPAFAAVAAPGSNVQFTAPSGAQVISKIELMTPWRVQSGPVATCLHGSGCNAPTANFRPLQIVNDPSGIVQGPVGLFQIDAGPRYADTLYAHYVDNRAVSTLTNMIFDVHFMTDSNNAENLEFDLVHAYKNVLYMAGSQCAGYKGVWQGWAEGGSSPGWKNMNVPCPKLTPGQWHHFAMQVQFDHAAQTYSYVQVLIDGKSYNPGLTGMPARPERWGDGAGAQIQLDQNKLGAPVREWVTDLNITAW